MVTIKTFTTATFEQNVFQLRVMR